MAALTLVVLVTASVSALGNTAADDTIEEQGDNPPDSEPTAPEDTSEDTSEDSDTPDSKDSDTAKAAPQWFRHAGLGFRAGATFRETATSGEFPAAYALGPELYVAVFSHSIHRALLGAGYLYLDERREKGSYQIRVATRYQRVDLFAGYGIVWKLLTAGLRVGTALTIVEVQTTYGEPTWEIVGVGDTAELLMYEPADPEIRKERGVIAGLLGGLGIGLAIGRYLFGIDDLVEIRAQADYVRRGERDEFAVYGLLIIWPTRLFR